jgi:hypothetical protein
VLELDLSLTLVQIAEYPGGVAEKFVTVVEGLSVMQNRHGSEGIRRETWAD